MLEPLEIDDVRFSESNSEDHILIDYRSSKDPEGDWWTQAAFAHRSEVISLRDWLTEWLNTHPES